MTHARIGAVLTATVALSLFASQALAAGAWSIVSSPPTGDNAYLYAVSADSGTDAWAVGSIGPSSHFEPLIDHWNGTSWSESTPPSYPSESVNYDAVGASSSTDAWAVGFTEPSKSDYYPDTVHWNGSSWTDVAAVQCTTGGVNVSADLTGVADISPSDAFAIGECVSHASQIVEHWNGTAWSLMTLPDPDPANPGMGQSLTGISADSATDVWAVGEHLVLTGNSTTPDRYEPWSAHWNGSTWTVVPMPAVPGTDLHLIYQLRAVDAISPTNVWAVGDSGDLDGVGGTSTTTLIEHYNGTSWSVVPSPTTGTVPMLNGVSGAGSSSAWAVGYDTPAGGTQSQTLTLNWNDSAWSIVSSPDVGTASRLVGAATAPNGTDWAVGYSGTSGAYNPLALENSG